MADTGRAAGRCGSGVVADGPSAGGRRPGPAQGRAPLRPRRLGARRRPVAAGAAGGVRPPPGARAAHDPDRPHAGLAVRVLPRRPHGDGPRPGHHPEHRDHRAGLRRRPPAQLRPVRHPRAQPGVRPQRLRRDPARALGVGRQAAGHQLRGGRPHGRVPAGAGPAGGPGRGPHLPGAAGPLRRDAAAGRLVLAGGRGRHHRPVPGRRRRAVAARLAKAELTPTWTPCPG